MSTKKTPEKKVAKAEEPAPEKEESAYGPILDLSDAAVKTAMRRSPLSSARSKPFMFGTSAEYRTPDTISSCAMSSRASAS